MEYTVSSRKISTQGLSHADLLDRIREFLEENTKSADFVEVRLIAEESTASVYSEDDPSRRVMF